MSIRVYCDGALTKKLLRAKLDEGLVLTTVIRGRFSGGDVVYFRVGTSDEIAEYKRKLSPETPTDGH